MAEQYGNAISPSSLERVLIGVLQGGGEELFSYETSCIRLALGIRLISTFSSRLDGKQDLFTDHKTLFIDRFTTNTFEGCTYLA